MKLNCRKRIISLVALAAFAILAVGSSDSGGGGSSGTNTSSDKKVDAFVMSHDFVKNQLKAPSTAKFPWYDDSCVDSLGNSRYRVTSYVDAQNSFGAMLRSNYICELEYVGNDKWRCIKCTLLEQ